jgi:hypothetical protein
VNVEKDRKQPTPETTLPPGGTGVPAVPEAHFQLIEEIKRKWIDYTRERGGKRRRGRLGKPAP